MSIDYVKGLEFTYELFILLLLTIYKGILLNV
jgi:hypothetical protein